MRIALCDCLWVVKNDNRTRFWQEKLSFWKEIQMCSAEYLMASGMDYEAVAAALMALEPLDVVD